MKNFDLIFLRHGKLDLPYKDHGEMPFDVISDLATGILNPPVDKIYTEKLIEQVCSKTLFNKVRVICSSPSNRCQSTSSLVKNYLENVRDEKIDINIIKNAREVEFDLRAIINKSCGKNFDISNINDSVFSAMINGRGCEHINDIQKRVSKLFSTLLADERKKIIITHDFFMRVIELYIKRSGNLLNITYDDLINTTRNGYLCGFATDFSMNDIFYLRID